MSPSKHRRKFALTVLTGSRADAGIMGYIFQALAQEPELDLTLIATGAHTFQSNSADTLIQEFNQKPDVWIPIPKPGESRVEMGYSMQAAFEKFLNYFHSAKTDVLLILGDRYEACAAAQAAWFCQIPVIHFHGGETTLGSMDNIFRDAISRMASLHFVAAAPFKKRLIKMGIPDKTIHVSGAPGLDRIKAELNFKEDDLKITPNQTYILATFHPVSLLADLGKKEKTALLSALNEISLPIVFSLSFGEPFSEVFNADIREFIAKRKGKDILLTGEHPSEYLHYLKNAALVIGNSSSGLIEAPYFKVPVINVGERQKGRLATKHTLHIEGNKEALLKGIKQALKKDWRAKVQKDRNPYGQGKALETIIPEIQNWLHQNIT